jgi:lysylphosphatidylglycerol synthetase-like protein (DUF2156 family)
VQGGSAQEGAARLDPRVLSLVQRYGDSATSFQVLEPGLCHRFYEPESLVAFADTGKAWVTAGAPVGPGRLRSQVMSRFAADAESTGRRVRFFALECERVPAGMCAVPIGEQPSWDPRRWPETLQRKRSLREQLRRARARGVTTRQLAAHELCEPGAPLRPASDALIGRWLRSRRMAPMGFLVRLHLYEHGERRRYFAAEQAGRLVGLAVGVPIYARNGWLLEDLLRDPTAPSGTVELLFDTAMRALAAEGALHLTTGMAPLSGAAATWLQLVRDGSRWLYDFHGLRAFKAKLLPDSWEPLYLAHRRCEPVLHAVMDVLRAFAGGSLRRFARITAAHRLAALAVAPRAHRRSAADGRPGRAVRPTAWC